MTDPLSPTPAGWFPDPLGRHEHRYFNGSSWTADVSDGGARYVDPLGITPGASAGYGIAAEPGSHRRNGIATAALTCGIIGVALAWVPFVVVIGVILASIAVVLGVRGLRRSAEIGMGRGFAITGIITGIGGLVLSVLGLVLTVIVYRAIDDFIDPGPLIAEVRSCTIDGRDAVVEGEVSNRSTDERSYTVFVTIDDATEVVAINAVLPGETVAWSTDIRVRASDGECVAAVDVQGPFPFGIEIDAVEG